MMLGLMRQEVNSTYNDNNKEQDINGAGIVKELWFDKDPKVPNINLTGCRRSAYITISS